MSRFCSLNVRHHWRAVQRRRDICLVITNVGQAGGPPLVLFFGELADAAL